MFISVLDIFKIGIGPSSSHTMGPMVAAKDFVNKLQKNRLDSQNGVALQVRCTLKGSLAFTGHGHATDRAVALGMHGYLPEDLANTNVQNLISELWESRHVVLDSQQKISFYPPEDIIFDYKDPLPQHPNGMIFECFDSQDNLLLTETYFSIGGGFISTLAEIDQVEAPIKGQPASEFKYPFNSAASMLEMAKQHNLSIAQMKQANELCETTLEELDTKLHTLWQAMHNCVENGLQTEGILPGGLKVKRRAKNLYQHLLNDDNPVNANDWLCAYAMAVNEENAAGHMVVTAPTNGAAGVIPAVLYYFVKHENGTLEDIKTFLLTAAAIGGLIKHKSSISGAEVGCQGEVGSASAMAAAGLCAVRGGTVMQIEQAAEMALEHHLGMTCDPVKGLVQVPCIERNGFGAIKAFTAASIALRESGEHIMPLDSCIAAMKKTGDEMSHKYKETSLGGLAVTWVEC
ncbi:L-serine dehydratase [Thiomicrorhabdus immobilis]|uniref:L-serine dehydratase n=1 Tax=Thiomicrorhabdus immobilis TaxID=2791037 RepID=A0ABN6CYN9_9GAMM|nr:L-serine ammonia-lyase [Thiomicrorhabdus immobilis]BCN94183.1 L-serine dehydratase [Thiomicrorhabdus immobilis]